MKKKTLFAFWAFIFTVIFFAGCSGSGPDVSAEEGRQILLSNTAYFNAHTQTDIVWKSRGKTNNIDEFTALYASQIQDFTDEEKKVLDAIINIVEARFDYLGVRLPTMGEVTFVPYSTPELIHGIYETMLELYPR